MLSEDELRIVFAEFDANDSGTVDSVEFTGKLAVVRGEPHLHGTLSKSF